MNELETRATDAVTMSEMALREAGALIGAYSLSFVGAIVLLFIGYIAAGIFERWLYSALGRIKGVDETLRRFLSKVVRYTILILVAVTALAQFGVQTTSIIAALGAAGLAVGLALQGTLQNIAAGIMLLVLRPFRVGEFITTPTISGTIEEIGLFATELRGADGLYIFAPNSLLWNVPVTNATRNPLRRTELALTIAYGDDVATARQVLLDLAAEDRRILEEPAPETFVATLGDAAVGVTLHYWTATADFWKTKIDMTQKAKAAFEAKGLTIPVAPRLLPAAPSQ
ncbi:MAG: mechanosensitive ion channel family protein [Aliihoeflea sp.]